MSTCIPGEHPSRSRRWTRSGGRTVTRVRGRHAPAGGTRNVHAGTWDGSPAAGAPPTFGCPAGGTPETPSPTRVSLWTRTTWSDHV
jgi:hypothetical protein